MFPFLIYGAGEAFEGRWLGIFGWLVFTGFLVFLVHRRAARHLDENARRIAALETEKARYRAVVEQSEDGIAVIEIETMRVLDCNRAFCRLIGCETAVEAKKMTANDFNADEDWRKKYKVRESNAEKVCVSGEKNYRRLDGTLVPVEVNAGIIRYDGRDVYCINVKDITERKKDEAELTRLAIVAQKTQNAVIITDAEGVIQWVNEGFTRLTGFEYDEAVGGFGYLLQGDDTDAEVVETIRATMWARKPYSGEIYNYKKDGTGFWMSISITPTFDEQGAVQGFVAVQMDITDRRAMQDELQCAYDDLEFRVVERTAELIKANEIMQSQVVERERAEVELKQAQQFLRKVIDSVPNLIFVKDSEQRYTLANNATANLFGTTVENIIGKRVGEFHHNLDEANQLAADDTQVLESLQEKFISEEKITDGDGNVRWLQIVKRPMIIGEDRSRHVLGVATDLTERKILESQLRHSHKMESIGQLAAGVAHEINTPTQYVSDNTLFVKDSFADIKEVLDACGELIKAAKAGNLSSQMVAEIERKFDDRDIEYLMDEVPKAVNQSLEGISRISKIVRSMRTLSHPGNVEKRVANLNQAIESTAIVAQNEWKYCAELETHFDENLPAVPCLLDEINQVILNMIVNAAHSIADVVGDDGTRGKGKITITTNRVDDWAEIRIKDTGTGIPPEAQNRIFDPFFTTKEVGKGTGQGLAISHNVVVKKHHGQLTFETAPEHGTTFIIKLPLENDQNAGLAV